MDYTKKSWNSLSQLKSVIESSKGEKVKDFDGIRLITNKYVYTLYQGELSRNKL